MPWEPLHPRLITLLNIFFIINIFYIYQIFNIHTFHNIYSQYMVYTQSCLSLVDYIILTRWLDVSKQLWSVFKDPLFCVRKELRCEMGTPRPRTACTTMSTKVWCRKQLRPSLSRSELLHSIATLWIYMPDIHIHIFYTIIYLLYHYTLYI